jgi:type VI secretion system protein ImpF
VADRGETPSVSRQEAVQPSLWDRLVDDLPGLVAESDALRRDLSRALGADGDAEALISGGTRGIEKRDDLDEDTRLLAHRVVQIMARRRRLEDSGIIVTADVLREAVRRDIEMLFNNERLEAQFLLTDREALDHPHPATLLEAFPDIDGVLLLSPVPERLRLSTSIDLDSGRARTALEER